MPETKIIDERELWEFAERTAKRVETWPDWKKEGWVVLDRRKDIVSVATLENRQESLGEPKESKTRLD